MSMPAGVAAAAPIIYPESDGQPMSDNTKQFRWIVTLAGNLQALFRDRQDVFVCGNQNWYPVEGEPGTCVAPDVYAVFGRPKGDRPSYLQWKEDNVPLTVVFEVLSPSNDATEMTDKFVFYEEYGVEEYYLYNPDTNRLVGYGRRGSAPRRVQPIHGFVSPRLGIRFDLSGSEMRIYHPNGRPFLTFEELEIERLKETQRADQAEQRLARVSELSRKALRQEATPVELQELQQLLQE